MTRKEAEELIRYTWVRNIDHIPSPPEWMSKRAFERELDVRVLSKISDFLASLESDRADNQCGSSVAASIVLKDVLRALRPLHKWNDDLPEYFLTELLKHWDVRLRWFPDEAAVTWPLERFVREICDESLLLGYGAIALTGKDSKTRVDARRKLAALLVHIIGMLQTRRKLQEKETE